MVLRTIRKSLESGCSKLNALAELPATSRSILQSCPFGSYRRFLCSLALAGSWAELKTLLLPVFVHQEICEDFRRWEKLEIQVGKLGEIMC